MNVPLWKQILMGALVGFGLGLVSEGLPLGAGFVVLGILVVIS